MRLTSYFTRFEIILWIVSVVTISVSALIFGPIDILVLIASLVGTTFLILNAKGNVWGQILTVVFSIMYGVISYNKAYYGEMITYLGMTAPIAMASIITWIKNPSDNGKNEVEVNHLKKVEYIFLFFLSCGVTSVFFFILRALDTPALIFSTLSVFTSFVASYLTMRRCEFFALAYASNDLVLIILWIIATLQNKSYISVVVCFVIFLINDLYGFFSWQQMKKNQAKK
ncbi:MAG: nicotinamide mononucleotide transporter [Pseudobutyrivibrio sp.]|nr:nicotinamide mononucleotide transporter [Pseudobutyrivibrio sp.]